MQEEVVLDFRIIAFWPRKSIIARSPSFHHENQYLLQTAFQETHSTQSSHRQDITSRSNRGKWPNIIFKLDHYCEYVVYLSEASSLLTTFRSHQRYIILSLLPIISKLCSCGIFTPVDHIIFRDIFTLGHELNLKHRSLFDFFAFTSSNEIDSVAETLDGGTAFSMSDKMRGAVQEAKMGDRARVKWAKTEYDKSGRKNKACR
jgi:hypothetical protein